MEQDQKNRMGNSGKNNAQTDDQNLNDQVQNSATGQKKANNRNDGNDRGISGMNSNNMDQAGREESADYQKEKKNSMDMNKENVPH